MTFAISFVLVVVLVLGATSSSTRTITRPLGEVISFCLTFTLVCSEPLQAQAPKDRPAANGPRLGDARTETYYVGVAAAADREACAWLFATIPVPMDWPEQTVTVLKEKKSPHVTRLEYRVLGEGVKQMRLNVASLPAKEEAHALLTLKVERRAILPPADPAQLAVPEKPDAKLRPYLQPSPFIESTDPAIRALAAEVVAGKEGPWQRVEAIYDATRAKIKYQDGPIKGALAALKEGTGDAEELTCLFIALCRASRIPARTVWVPGHCYAEFYLVERAGQGHWLPCELVGPGSLGSIAEYRLILQKGDSFMLPEKPNNKPKRYVAEYLSCKTGRPTVEFIRERVKESEVKE
jgi:hypothetical protein